MLFSDFPERRHTLVLALWNDLKLPSVGFAFQEEKASSLKATSSPRDSAYQGREDGYDICR